LLQAAAWPPGELVDLMDTVPDQDYQVRLEVKGYALANSAHLYIQPARRPNKFAALIVDSTLPVIGFSLAIAAVTKKERAEGSADGSRASKAEGSLD
jgi:hypothetical protein